VPETDEIQFAQSLRRLGPLIAASPPEEALAEVLRMAVRFAEADAGNIQQVVHRGGRWGGAGGHSGEHLPELRIVAHQGFGEEFLRFFACVEPGISVCGLALARRERVIIENVRESPHLASPVRSTLERAGIISVVSTPIPAGVATATSGEILGMLSVHYRRAGGPGPEALVRLDLLTEHAGEVLGAWAESGGGAWRS
jgi:hypothetical protein